MQTYKLRVFDSNGKWFSTKTVQDYEANGANINQAIDQEFGYWNPGSVSAIAVDDSRGQLRRVTYQQWSRGRNESAASRIVGTMLDEEFSLNPHYTTNAGNKPGESSEVSTTPKKEGDEFQQTGEEKREIAIANRILAAAEKMAKTPDVDQIIRLAAELKKMHGV